MAPGQLPSQATDFNIAIPLTMPGQIDGSTNGATDGAAHHNDKLPKELVNEMQTLFGKHLGYRTSRILLLGYWYLLAKL